MNKNKIFRNMVVGMLSIATMTLAGHPELPVNLGSSGNFGILAKAGISSVPPSAVTGDMGVSPVTSTAITGFSLVMDPSGEFSTSAQVTGKIYAPDYRNAAVMLTTAVSDMETAYVDAAGRTIPDEIELGFGDISGMNLAPGLYKWSSGLLINTDVTLTGSATDVWIFQIAQTFNVANGVVVHLAGGARAENIFWQVGSSATIGTTAHVEGNILSLAEIVVNNGASVNGRLLSQTAVTLDGVAMSQPAKQYTLTYSAGFGGTVSGLSPQIVNEGDDGSMVTASPLPGFAFVQWSDGSLLNPRTDLNVMADITVVAQFLGIPPSTPGCGILVTLGAVTENDLSAMFVGTNLTYTVLSTNPAVMSAEITLNDDLRTMALSHGLTEIIVTATDPLTLITQTNAFAIKVVDHPTLVSSVYPPHEPWNPRFVQQIEVRNDDTCDAIGLRLMFTDLKPGIVVENQNAVEPDDGRPAIVLSFPFQPGESKTLSVVYLSSGAFRPDQSPPTVEIEYVLPDVPPGPQGKTGPNIQRIETLGDGRVVLEFNSVAGLHYRIELMDNYPSHPWITVALDLLAGANRTQWIDHGPPATPVPSGLRVYRVLQVLP